MNRERIARRLFLTMALGTAAVLLVLFGMWSGYHQTGPFNVSREVIQHVRDSFDSVGETSVFRPDNLLQPARYAGSGVTVNEFTNDGDWVLLSGFFGESNEIRLIRRDGSIVNRWQLSFSKIFEDKSFLSAPPSTDWNADTHGALILPDGSIVFNFDYNGSAKIDACGSVLWTVPHQTHHSIERAEAGGFWVPGQQFIDDGKTRYPPFSPPIAVNTIVRLSDSGQIVKQISVPELFYKNDLEAVLTSVATYYEPRRADSWNREIVHLNKIDELTSDLVGDFPMFEQGDLLLSLRNLNMALVVDPDTEVIKWWRIGPWLRQHDAEYMRGGKIAVFNNNIYLHTAFESQQDRTTKKTGLDVPRVSNIIAADPGDGSYEILYGSVPGQEFLSVTRGKVEITAGNGLLITEFDGGRVFETDSAGRIIWEYINRYDEDEVSEITEARIYSKDYFDNQNWSCGKPQN